MAEAWDRRKGESAKAHAAFIAYCEMGAGRSIRALHAQYIKQPSSNRQAKNASSPKLSTLFTWSARHGWPARAEAWDQHERAERARRRTEARRRIEDEGLEDADRLHAEWRRTYDEALARATSIAVEAGARVDGQPTIRVTVDARSVRGLAHARLEIETLRRRALGMPERITQKQAEDANDGAQAETVDLSHLSLDELLALAEKIEGEEDEKT